MIISEGYRKFYIVILSILYIVCAKLGALPEVNLWIVLTLIASSVILLTLLSPPVASALVFMSHNLIGLVTLAHPGFLIQILPAIILILTLIYVRRAEIKNSIIHWKIFRRETWGLLLIVSVFIMGFLQAVSISNAFMFSYIINLFKSSQGGLIDYYPYVFMSRWAIFIVIGSLCCRGEKELKIFFLAFSIFAVTQLLSVPLSTYAWVLKDMCAEILNITGLQSANVNRAYLGYLLACAAFSLMVFALNEPKRQRAFYYYGSSAFFLFMCFIAGSKGPLAAFGVSCIFFVLFNHWKLSLKAFAFGVIFIALTTFIPKIFGCNGGLLSIVKSSAATTASSIEVRKDLAKSEYKNVDLTSVFGHGFGASIITVESTFVNPMTNKPITMSTSSGSHNLFIDFLVDLGIVGLVGFLIGLYILIAAFFKNVRNSPERKMLITQMIGLLLILLVYSILATAPSMATVQALFVGILYGVGIKSPKQT